MFPITWVYTRFAVCLLIAQHNTSLLHCDRYTHKLTTRDHNTFTLKRVSLLNWRPFVTKETVTRFKTPQTPPIRTQPRPLFYQSLSRMCNCNKLINLETEGDRTFFFRRGDDATNYSNASHQFLRERKAYSIEINITTSPCKIIRIVRWTNQPAYLTRSQEWPSISGW